MNIRHFCHFRLIQPTLFCAPWSKNKQVYLLHLQGIPLPTACKCKQPTPFCVHPGLSSRVFHEHTELTIMAILASKSLLTWKPKKNPTTKCFPTEHWTQPFGSNALLSEPLGQVLLGISLNCLLFLHHFNKSMTIYDILALPSSTCLNGSERRALDLNGWGSESNFFVVT